MTDSFQPLGSVAIVRENRTIGSMSSARDDFEVKEARAALLKLAVLPAPGSEQDPETRMAIYWDVLKSRLSPATITRVCRRVLAGDVGNPRWLPSPGEMIRFAKSNYLDPDPWPPPSRLPPPSPAPYQAKIYEGLKNLARELAGPLYDAPCIAAPECKPLEALSDEALAIFRRPAKK